MTSSTGIALSKLIQSPGANNRQKVGLFTRRPSQNQSFLRKKTQDIFFVDGNMTSKENSREKTRSQIGRLQHQRSLQLFKENAYQNMKFLSPEHQTQSKVLSSFRDINCKGSPRFSRKNQLQPKKSVSTSFLVKNDSHKLEDTFGTCISQISLQSFIVQQDSDEITQTHPQTMDEPFQSSRQNMKLRQYNLTLVRDIQIYKVKCDYLEAKLSKYEAQSRKSTGFSNKCSFCTLLQEKIIKNGRHTGMLEVTLAQKDKELEEIKNYVRNKKKYYQKLTLEYDQLYKQFQNITSKYLQQQKAKLQLSHIITCLNSKLDDTTEQIRYLGIQQSILLKKKHEYEQSKAQSAKLISQKQILKKLVAQYKQKIDITRKINSKKKASKQKGKDNFYEDIFQLSSDHSADGR